MKIRIEFSNGFVGCKRVIIENIDDWDYMSDEEKEKYVLDIVLEHISWSYEAIE